MRIEARETDRRRLPRMRLDHPVVLEEPSTGARFEGRARSLSGGGILFDTERDLAPGAILELTLAPPSRLTAPLRARLEIVRSERSDEGTLRRVAGRFVRLD